MNRRRWTSSLVVAVVGLAACAGVLGLRRAPEPKGFEHRAHVLKGIQCTECHTTIAQTGDLDPAVLPDDASCLTCHKKPHDPRSCRGCHGSAAAAGAAIEARKHLTFSHATHVPRRQGDCVRCHVSVTEQGETLRPKMAACLACHPHDEQFTPERCDTCHVDLETERVLPESHLVHEGDWVREHGVRAATAGDMCMTCHSQRACAACHGATTAALPARLAFDDPMKRTIHRAGFRSRHAEEAHADPGACSVCHAPSSCATCHEREKVDASLERRSPHGAGWVGLGAGDNEHGRAARRDPASCASCHGGAGEQLCVSCHRVGGIGGNPHPPGFNSFQPLSERPCRLCHL
jgi:hypothetical protein